MNDDRDPAVSQLFAAAQRELSQDAFTEAVARSIHTRQRRILLGRLSILALLVLLELVLEWEQLLQLPTLYH